MSGNCLRVWNKYLNSISFCFTEQWDLTEYHLPWTTMSVRWWASYTSSRLHSIWLKHSLKQIAEFRSSSCCSLEWTLLLMLSVKLLSTIFLLETKSSSIFLWVKVRKNQQRTLCSTQLKKVTGCFFKIYIWCKHGWKESMVWKVCLRQSSPTAILTSESSWVHSLLHYQTWTSFLSRFFRAQSKFPTKRPNI